MPRKEKLFIQKRIMIRLSKRLPEFWFLVIFFSFIAIFSILEKSEYSYSNYLAKLEYSQIKDLVSLIVTTDGFIIAFTGVIASMILKQVFEEEKKRPPSLYGFVDEKRFEFEPNYGKRRHEIIKFVWFILVTLMISIGFSLGVIITQCFPYEIWSIVFLFIGLVELIGMITYSLKT